MNTQPSKNQLAAKLALAGSAGLVAGALSLGAAAPALADTAGDTSNQAGTADTNNQQPGPADTNPLTQVSTTINSVLGIVGNSATGLLRHGGTTIGQTSTKLARTTGEVIASIRVCPTKNNCAETETGNHNEGAAVDDGQ